MSAFNTHGILISTFDYAAIGLDNAGYESVFFCAIAKVDLKKHSQSCYHLI